MVIYSRRVFKMSVQTLFTWPSVPTEARFMNLRESSLKSANLRGFATLLQCQMLNCRVKRCVVCVSSDYAHGVTMLSPFTSEKKQLVSFCSPSGEELRKFAEELREAITEVNEMEQIHIQCKQERTCARPPHTHTHK